MPSSQGSRHGAGSGAFTVPLRARAVPDSRRRVVRRPPGRLGLGDRVDEAVVRRERRVRAEAAVASPILLGLVGVGGFGDMSEPSENKNNSILTQSFGDLSLMRNLKL